MPDGFPGVLIFEREVDESALRQLSFVADPSRNRVLLQMLPHERHIFKLNRMECNIVYGVGTGTSELAGLTSQIVHGMRFLEKQRQGGMDSSKVNQVLLAAVCTLGLIRLAGGSPSSVGGGYLPIVVVDSQCGSTRLLKYESYRDAQAKLARTLRSIGEGREFQSLPSQIAVLAAFYLQYGGHEELSSLYGKLERLITRTPPSELREQALPLLTYLGEIGTELGHYAEAQGYLSQARYLSQNYPDPCWEAHIDLALAHLAVAQGYYTRAQDWLDESRFLLEISDRADSVTLAHTLNLQGLIDTYKLDYLSAEYHLLEARRLLGISLGYWHPFVASTITNMARLRYCQANLVEAERLYEEALAIFDRTSPAMNTHRLEAMLGFARVLVASQRFDQAHVVLKDALGRGEVGLGPNHPGIGMVLAELGSLNYELRSNNHTKYIRMAIDNLERAIAILNKPFSPQHPALLRAIAALATVYRYIHDYSRAESLCASAIASCETEAETASPAIVSILMTLANCYRDERRYGEAMPMYEKAIAMQKALGSLGPDATMNLLDLSRFHRMRGDVRAAWDAALETLELGWQTVADQILLMPEREALKYREVQLACVDRLLTTYFDLPEREEHATLEVADAVLQSKGGVTDLLAQRHALRGTTDYATAVVDSLSLIHQQISVLYTSEIPSSKDLETMLKNLRKRKERLERRLASLIADHADAAQVLDTSVAKVLSALRRFPMRTTVVEYFKYQYWVEPNGYFFRYLALVLTSDSEVRIVQLGDAADIDFAVRLYCHHMRKLADSRSGPTLEDMEYYTRLGRRLYEILVEPIEGHLEGSDLVIICSDAEISRISFAGLIAGDGKYLIEHYPVHYIAAARDLLALGKNPKRGKGLLAIGAPDYDALPERGALKPELDLLEHGQTSIPCKERFNIVVPPLPESRREVEAVAHRWREVTGEPAYIYVGKDATEERVKADAPGKRVLHLATHGYHLASCSPGKIYPSADRVSINPDSLNPLVLSGLFLARANLHGRGFENPMIDDGTLTSEEILALDLRGTDLVVLSGCETATGELEDAEGVYGPVRAFRLAGARTIIGAMWPVSDRLAAEVCSAIYSTPPENIAFTLNAVELKVLKELRSHGMIDHPVRWAAFVSSGDWR